MVLLKEGHQEVAQSLLPRQYFPDQQLSEDPWLPVLHCRLFCFGFGVVCLGGCGEETVKAVVFTAAGQGTIAPLGLSPSPQFEVLAVQVVDEVEFGPIAHTLLGVAELLLGPGQFLTALDAAAGEFSLVLLDDPDAFEEGTEPVIVLVLNPLQQLVVGRELLELGLQFNDLCLSRQSFRLPFLKLRLLLHQQLLEVLHLCLHLPSQRHRLLRLPPLAPHRPPVHLPVLPQPLQQGPHHRRH